MTLSIDSIPHIEKRPTKSVNAHARNAAKRRWQRREFLRLVGGAATGLGLAVLSGLPPLRIGVARATHISTPHSNFASCGAADYVYAGIPTCQPCISTGSNVSSSFCSSSWHRTHEFNNYAYDLRTSTQCGNSTPKKHAWHWQIGECCSGRRNRIYRCSDGRRRPISQGSWVNTVCLVQTSTGTATGCPT